MTGQLPPLVQRILDKVGKSRDLSISFLIHAILVAIFGLLIATQTIPPADSGFVSSEEKNFVSAKIEIPKPPEEKANPISVGSLAPIVGMTSSSPIMTVKAADFQLPTISLPAPQIGGVTQPPLPGDLRPQHDTSGLTPEVAAAIKQFADWRGSQAGSRQPEFIFTAYIGQYQGGNWDSTVRLSQGKIETGSLPNLLYLMSYWSKEKVQTNYKNVRAIRLDSDELFTVKPPFIFLTGTRDFTLTDKEVENLRNYLRVGGCVWGDSSVPGRKSRFDTAFKREMRRVVGGDQDFAPLPTNHPLFSRPYFAEVKSEPAGLNSYQLPITALKMFGEVAVIYTANDYGDMWQIGLNSKGEIDLRRDASGRPVAINESIYAQRGVYVRNITPEALETSFKFGTNVVMHLLTRWETRLGGSSPL